MEVPTPFRTPESSATRLGAETREPARRHQPLVDVKLRRGPRPRLHPARSPSYDYYGGDRPGANLYGNSLVALDCRTGSRRWHFQTIHHDIWDWDLPSQPSLVEVVRDGKPVKAVTIATKTGFVFVFDRATASRSSMSREHPVPAGDVPGEYYHPTQPRPVLPKPFIRQSNARGRNHLRNAGITRRVPGDARGRFHRRAAVPAAAAAVDRILPRHQRRLELRRRALDPESDTFYINSMDVGSIAMMVPRGEDAAIPWRSRSGPRGRFWDSNRYPCQQPPWGHLTAIDLNTGEFRWQSILGEYDELTERGSPQPAHRTSVGRW